MLESRPNLTCEMSGSTPGTGIPMSKETKAQDEGIGSDAPKANALAATQRVMSPASNASTTKTTSTTIGSGSKSFSSPSASRPPYVPQFSAATQMILKRMRGETGGLATALASVTAPGAPKPNFTPSTYESARKQIVANMHSGKDSVTRAKSLSSPSTPPATLTLPASSTPKVSKESVRLLASQKRKRGRDDDSDVSSLAEASDYGEGIKKKIVKASASSTPTTTKSGRHILKPDTYDPAAEDNIKKRNQLGKRTTEQALCKKCTRMHSPASNQMVFCDGCNDPWHQLCHDPWIEDEIVKNPAVSWYCTSCAAKRERLQPKKKIFVQSQKPALGPWPNKGPQEKYAYLASLPPSELVNLLMHANKLHPDLPIFPVQSTPKTATGSAMPRGFFAGTSTEGLFSRSEANPTAPMNFVRKIPANAKKSTIAKARSGPGSLQSKAAAQAQSSRSSGHQLLPEEEDSSFTKLWPKPGMGMYSRLVLDEDDDSQLVDGNDYDAFSVIVFDERGKKIEENGVKV